ncbi:MAG: peptide-methionine (S)-S-oxide reductase [Clostridia bacterium]|nr:peptide-methionine (S)-S-oxide reductase [Deltaproteobacteria bacterium]
MVTALQTARRDVPKYLEALASRGGSFAEVYLVMGCFWTGEACVGALDGVASTRVGYLNHNEVVEVQPAFGADLVSVVADATKRGCATEVYVTNQETRAALAKASIASTLTSDRFSYSAKDDKYALRNNLQSIKLSPEQATRVNAAVANGGDPLPWLTPKQRASRVIGNAR